MARRRYRQESLPLADLVALRRNPQYLSPAQMDALKESIRRDGFLAPVLVRPMRSKRGKYEIISGNHRVMAARELGMRQVPCLIASLDDKTAQRVAVNLNTVHGDPTPELLAPFLAEMDDETLASVHLDDEMLAGVVAFDAELRAKLDELQVPKSLDRDSPTGSIRKCICPTCGKHHIAPSDDV